MRKAQPCQLTVGSIVDVQRIHHTDRRAVHPASKLNEEKKGKRKPGKERKGRENSRGRVGDRSKVRLDPPSASLESGMRHHLNQIQASRSLLPAPLLNVHIPPLKKTTPHGQ